MNYFISKEARELDKLIDEDKLNDKQRNSPVLGVPFTCTELLPVENLKFTHGLLSRKNNISTSNADVVKLMCEAGAIQLCTTVTSELGLWFESSNFVYGKSKNPYDSRRTIGGSCGGEACLIASCGSLIGVGCDFNGSIRVSSSFNGIFGHKPTNGKFFLNQLLFFVTQLHVHQISLYLYRYLIFISIL